MHGAFFLGAAAGSQPAPSEVQALSPIIPPHLKKYAAPQRKYTSQDQAVWRYILRGIRGSLSRFGAAGGLKGLEQTGITLSQIPKISDISRKLQKFGWRAVPVSGFIPPKAFMEFQLNGVLPVASEIRSIDHVSYTPAPDIVHEAAGHVPFLPHPVFSDFLKKYAETVLKAISSHEDQKQYLAIRELSDLKENPRSSKRQVQAAARRLRQISKSMSFASEAARLSRFIWWTSEYGLMGSLKNPKIYGAGLISSIQEARQISRAKKLRLSARCLDFPYDITSFQPQLFVAEDFSHLTDLLAQIAGKLSFKRGGLYGARQALKSKTINTLALDSGLQISGRVESLVKAENDLAFVRLGGSCQLSFEGRQLPGHGADFHHHGYSSPLKPLIKGKKPLFLRSDAELAGLGLRLGRPVRMQFPSRIVLEGAPSRFLRRKGRLLLISFKSCQIQKEGRTLYDPSWGAFDLAIGGAVRSVFSGPADPGAFGAEDDFQPPKIPPRKFSQKQKSDIAVFSAIEALKASPANRRLSGARRLLGRLKRRKGCCWLEALELLDAAPEMRGQILAYLKKSGQSQPEKLKLAREGLSF